MIELKNVCKSFGSLLAVDDVSLTVEDRKLFSFLGPNGAGKTTTIKMITGLMVPDSGSILLDGIDIVKDPIGAKQITGYIPDAPNLYEKMTGVEFLQLMGSLYGMASSALHTAVDEYCQRLDMTGWITDRIEGYSRGMKQRVVFASAMLHEPRILVIDEPMVGLDPQTIRVIKVLLKEKARSGITILLSTHDLHTAEELSDHILIINKGRICASGTLADLQAGQTDTNLESLYFSILDQQVPDPLI